MRLKGWLDSIRHGGALKHKLLRGGAWLGAGNLTEQSLRFTRNIILTRLLAPEAFGQMAIVLALSSLFQVLTGMGLKEAVIQSPRGSEKAFLNSAWWISLARGFSLYVTAYLAAPWLGDFYHDTTLVPLIRVAFVNVLFQSCISTRAWVALKELQYSRWIFIQQGGNILGILTTVLLATQIRGVWALALGYAAEAAYRCVLSFVLCPMRPTLDWDREANRQLLAFTKGIFGLPLLMMAYNETSTFVLGKLVDKEVLGLYAMALTLARTPSAVGGMLVDLLMPAFSKMQNQPERLNRSLLRVTGFVSLVGVPTLVLAWNWGKAALVLVYGPKYGSMALAFAILFANEILLTSNIALASAFLALGQPALLRKFSLIRAIVVVVIAYPLIKFAGPVGAGLAPLLAMVTAFGFQLSAIHRFTGLSVKAYGLVWLKAIAVAAGVLLVVVPIRALTLEATPLACVLTAALCGLIIGGALALATWRSPAVRRFLLPV